MDYFKILDNLRSFEQGRKAVLFKTFQSERLPELLPHLESDTLAVMVTGICQAFDEWLDEHEFHAAEHDPANGFDASRSIDLLREAGA